MNLRYLLCSLIFMISHAQSIDPLDEISMLEPELIVLLDEQVSSACRTLNEMWNTAGCNFQNPHIQELLNSEAKNIDYETVLKALHACITATCNTNSPEEQALRCKLERIYNQLADEYDELATQINTRRIKCKYFCKVTTRDLVVNNNACIAKLIVKDALKVDNLTGALIANNGNITTGQIPADAIPDGSITNDKLANNAVTSDKIAPMTITPDETAFNPVVATLGEAKPLVVYRGSINADGTVISGTGFTSVRSGAGPFVYTINLTAQSYTDANSYQVFAQTLSGNSLTIAQLSGTQFSVTIAADEPFSLFTIGA
ncbi:MAG: hypothetical protein WD055_05055 [Candidatus Dependentiae bacterium]